MTRRDVRCCGTILSYVPPFAFRQHCPKRGVGVVHFDVYFLEGVESGKGKQLREPLVAHAAEGVPVHALPDFNDFHVGERHVVLSRGLEGMEGCRGGRGGDGDERGVVKWIGKGRWVKKGGGVKEGKGVGVI